MSLAREGRPPNKDFISANVGLIIRLFRRLRTTLKETRALTPPPAQFQAVTVRPSSILGRRFSQPQKCSCNVSLQHRCPCNPSVQRSAPKCICYFR